MCLINFGFWRKMEHANHNGLNIDVFETPRSRENSVGKI